MKKISSLLALAGLFVSIAANCGAHTVVERFSTDPLQNGWQTFGDTNLFTWNSTNQNLEVTWDSTQPNSYFYLPLGKTLSNTDSFCVTFDLQLSDATAFQYGNEIAIGLLHFSDATNADFNRANSPFLNLFEFDFFPAFDYNNYSNPDTVNATVKDSQAGYNGLYWLADGFSFNPTNIYRVTLIHHGSGQPIIATIYGGSQLLTTFPIVNDYGPLQDFQLDTLAIENYADDGYGDSVLAHGTVSKIAAASPLPVDQVEIPAAGQIQFASDTNWLYTLEQTTNFQNWSSAATPVFGNGTNLLLQATNPPTDKSFYRVRADLP